MKNFHYSIPTEVFFGEGQINVLGNEIKKYASKVLLVYGGGSIKKNKIYDDVIYQLKSNNIEYKELSGIDPNPRLESVIEGRNMVDKYDLDFILGVGGGSVIDCAKAIGASAYYKGDPWDLVMDNSLIKTSLPIGAVLTLAATGSEMDGTAVISNLETVEKYSMKHKDLNPKFSIMDPTYTFSVSKYQTASGIADIMSHTMETYFSNIKTSFLQDRLAEAILLTCIEYGPKVLEEPKNYQARANIMWASSLAINGLLNYGKDNAWSVHTLEHELTAYYDDLPHGIGLAILTPHWMRLVLDEKRLWKFVEYGVNVWNIDQSLDDMDIAKLSIDKTEEFFKCLDIPMKLSDYNITDEYFNQMAKSAIEYRGGSIGDFKPLGFDDVIKILNDSL